MAHSTKGHAHTHGHDALLVAEMRGLFDRFQAQCPERIVAGRNGAHHVWDCAICNGTLVSTWIASLRIEGMQRQGSTALPLMGEVLDILERRGAAA